MKKAPATLKKSGEKATASKRKEASGEKVSAEKSNKLVRKVPVKKIIKKKEFWVKSYTTSYGTRIMFSDEALGPYQTKEEVVEAMNEKIEEIENNCGIDVSEENDNILVDRRDKLPARGEILVIENDREKYHFQISTKKPKIFDGSSERWP